MVFTFIPKVNTFSRLAWSFYETPTPLARRLVGAVKRQGCATRGAFSRQMLRCALGLSLYAMAQRPRMCHKSIIHMNESDWFSTRSFFNLSYPALR